MIQRDFNKFCKYLLTLVCGGFAEFTKSLDKVDVLFNAVGFVHHGTILDCEEKDWDFSFDVNIKSMYFMCRAILPLMIKQNGGSIINISSISSLK